MTKKAKPGQATILVVENEQAIREMVRMYLEGVGYGVLEAVDGDEAMALWETHAKQIDLVLADWMMPGSLDGCELVRQLQASRPTLKAIIVSGHSPETLKEEALLEGEKKFLPKPYRLDSLGGMVRESLLHSGAA